MVMEEMSPYPGSCGIRDGSYKPFYGLDLVAFLKFFPCSSLNLGGAHPCRFGYDDGYFSLKIIPSPG